MKPGSLPLPFLTGAKKMLARAQTGLGRAGVALLSAGWSQSDQAALTDTTERGWNTKCLLLTVPEAGESRIKLLADVGSGGGPLPTVTFCGAQGKGALWGLFHQGTNPPS